jgi:CheY-like chemotaxis protein
MNSSPQSSTVLLVEDNEDDVFLMQRLFKKEAIPLNLQVVTNGREAVQYLSGEDKFSDRATFPVPWLVFLDLKLPFLDGFDVLSWIRKQETLASLRVVILSSSLEDQDKERAATLGSPYFVKPPTPETVREAMQFASSVSGIELTSNFQQPDINGHDSV